jgi:hypothetical protein
VQALVPSHPHWCCQAWCCCATWQPYLLHRGVNHHSIWYGSCCVAALRLPGSPHPTSHLSRPPHAVQQPAQGDHCGAHPTLLPYQAQNPASAQAEAAPNARSQCGRKGVPLSHNLQHHAASTQPAAGHTEGRPTPVPPQQSADWQTHTAHTPRCGRVHTCPPPPPPPRAAPGGDGGPWPQPRDHAGSSSTAFLGAHAMPCRAEHIVQYRSDADVGAASGGPCQ